MRGESAASLTCTNCQHLNPPGVRFCESCGSRLSTLSEGRGEVSYYSKSKVTAAVLAWFLGAFGIHRLYIGKIGTGITMLILAIIMLVAAYNTGWSPFVTILLLFLGIFAIVYFITIVCGKMTDGDGDLIE